MESLSFSVINLIRSVSVSEAREGRILDNSMGTIRPCPNQPFEAPSSPVERDERQPL